MRKRIVSVLCAILLVITVGGGLVGCGGGSGRLKQVLLVCDGGLTETAVMTKLKDEYNRTQGPKDGVKLEFRQKGDDYQMYVQSTAKGRNAPDIILVNDRFFKLWTGNFGILANLTELSEQYGIDLGLDNLYSQGMERYHYNIANNTSNDDDPIYGVLRDVTPTILYYNKTAFERLGIICISAYEDEITQDYVDAFNAEHNLTGANAVTVNNLKRGFYRQYADSNGQYLNGVHGWVKPYDGEVMVFNNRIAMSWDEQEDLDRIMSKVYNDNVKLNTTYGHYQWWWFNYGFSVGGDCIEDVTGNGDWVFTVGDNVPNFIVADNVESVTVGQNTYTARETIGYRDRVKLNDALVTSLLANGSTLDASYLTQQVLDLEAEGKLKRLPSQQTAFARWVMLAQNRSYQDQYGTGLQVSPIPSESTITGQAGMFTSQEVAMLVDKSETFLTIDNAVKRMTGDAKFEWDIAPLAVYKEYNADGTVKVSGNPAGASDSNALSINAYSSKKKESMLVLKWLTSEAAQDIIAEASFTLPNNPNSAVKYVATRSDKNLSIIADAALYQTPGDWWYMPDRNWIEETWALALNNEVRNQKMTLTDFFEQYIPIGNTALQRYKK